MITSRQEYLSNLAEIQMGLDGEKYFPIPEAEKVYKIDLNTRKVEAPDLLSVTNDNEAEILFFEVDRYFDNMDLLRTTCVLLYTNALNESFVYPIPCVDAITKASENKLILPWVVGSDVTWKAGVIKFAFQFYEINTGTLEYEYMLNTAPATTKVLQGMEFKYVEANDKAEADWKANQWDEKYKNYFVKVTITTGNYRYAHANEKYNKNETYYLRAEEARISDGTKLEAIYQSLDELKKNSLKWVRI